MKQVWVFGSNLRGIHGAGAALEAKLHHGAIQGQGEGLQGDSYAIPTKATPYESLRWLVLVDGVRRFLAFAKENPDMEFLLTKVGCGLAGFTEEQISPLFKNAPSNVILPEGWTR